MLATASWLGAGPAQAAPSAATRLAATARTAPAGEGVAIVQFDGSVAAPGAGARGRGDRAVRRLGLRARGSRAGPPPRRPRHCPAAADPWACVAAARRP